jgi:hypothetical protein
MCAVSILPHRFLYIALLAVLTACGGGGDDHSDDVTAPHGGLEPVTCSSATIPCI